MSILKARRRVVEEALKVLEAEKPEILGLGSGSTVSLLIEVMGRRKMEAEVVCSSTGTALKAKSCGFKVLSLESVDYIDLYVDSADEVDGGLNMVKGGGGCLTLEKILAYNASKRVFIVDYGKLVDRLGVSRPIPLDVLPYAVSFICRRLEGYGVKAEPRVLGRGKFGPIVSDVGGVLLDLYVEGGVEDPAEFDLRLRAIPGVLETGVFAGLADLILVGYPDRVKRMERRR